MVPNLLLNLARIHEVIADAVADRECIVFGERRYTWRDTTERTRRFADVLGQHGLGCHRERDSLRGWESGQDHVALYLHNGNEYLEGMLGSFKARCAPFNVNYRYVEEELLYLFDNADARAIVFHSAFAPMLAKLRERLGAVKLWLQVEDASREALLPGAIWYEEALAQATPHPPQGLSPDDLYILYTGGTTGMPKGVLWRQEDIYRAALAGGRVRESESEFRDRALREPALRALPAPPFMHGAAHWVAFTMWHVGGTIIVQNEPRRLDPDDIWSTVERERVSAITIVGDAFARPLLDQLDEKRYDLSSLEQIGTGGAILTASLKKELLSHVPRARILDALGSSESGSQASHFSTKDAGARTGRFEMAKDNLVLKDDLSGPVAEGEEGWLARRGYVPQGYYKDPEKSAATFPTIGGVRYAVPGDRARLEADGSLALLGRASVTINSGGEKIFAEEVEQALKHHPEVYDAVVCPTPSERWGQQVTAIVQLRADKHPDDASLLEEAKKHIAGYKLPKSIVRVSEILRAPSGKADYRWARETAQRELARSDDRAD